VIVLLLAAPLAAEAQQAAKIPRIGYLVGNLALRDAFLQGLHDLGYEEGHNVVIEYRDPEGNYNRLPSLAAELVALKVDVIVVTSTPSTLAAKQATRTIPIVFTWAVDPVGSGLVTSLARPGGNVTGLSFLAPAASAWNYSSRPCRVSVGLLCSGIQVITANAPRRRC
jgi:putative ABC transport system substrate-binding protein